MLESFSTCSTVLVCIDFDCIFTVALLNTSIVENESLIKKSVIKKAQNALNELEKKHQEMRKQKMAKQQNNLEKKHSKEDEEKYVSSGEEEGVYLSENETSSTSYESYDSSDDSEHESEPHSPHAVEPSNVVVPAPANALSTTTTTTTSTVSSNHESLETKTIVSKTVKKVEVISKEKEVIACKGEVKTETTTTITKTTTKASGTKITSTTTKTTKTGNSNELSYEQQKQCVENIINSQNLESRFLFLIFIARLFAHNIKMAFEDMISLINQNKLLLECEQEKQALAKKKNSKVDKKKKKVIVEESDDEQEGELPKPTPQSDSTAGKKNLPIIEPDIRSESAEDEEEESNYQSEFSKESVDDNLEDDWNVVDYKKFRTKGRRDFAPANENQSNNVMSSNNTGNSNNNFADRRKSPVGYSASPQNKRSTATTAPKGNSNNANNAAASASKLESTVESKRLSPNVIPATTLQQSALETISPREPSVGLPTAIAQLGVSNNSLALAQQTQQQQQQMNNSKVVGFEYLQQSAYSPFGPNTTAFPTPIMGFPSILPPNSMFPPMSGFGDSSYYQNPFNLPTIFSPNPESGYIGHPFLIQPQNWGIQQYPQPQLHQQQAFGHSSHQ